MSFQDSRESTYSLTVAGAAPELSGSFEQLALASRFTLMTESPSEHLVPCQAIILCALEFVTQITVETPDTAFEVG
jgi:hypothetical protein